MKYSDLEKRLFNYTNGWSNDCNKEFPLDDRAERDNAVSILRKHYKNVNGANLDYDNGNVEGVGYKVEFSESVEDEDDLFTPDKNPDNAVLINKGSSMAESLNESKNTDDYYTAFEAATLEALGFVLEGAQISWEYQFEENNFLRAYKWGVVDEYASDDHARKWSLTYYENGHPFNTVSFERLDDLLAFIKDALNESIEKHDELNQNIWNGRELKPEVKEKLQLIADTFVEKLKEDDIPIDVKDIILVGSNVNYNYTKDSDLDLHIQADLSQFKGREKELAEKIYQCKKAMFNSKYDISLYGVPVEIYVEPYQDIDSNGIPDAVEEE